MPRKAHSFAVEAHNWRASEWKAYTPPYTVQPQGGLSAPLTYRQQSAASATVEGEFAGVSPY